MKVCKVYVDFTNLHIVFVFNVITSVRVPPLSLRGYEGWATCGQSMVTGSPLHLMVLYPIVSRLAPTCTKIWMYAFNMDTRKIDLSLCNNYI